MFEYGANCSKETDTKRKNGLDSMAIARTKGSIMAPNNLAGE